MSRTAHPLPLASRPVAALGFRPFFLLGGAFAALSIPLWLLELSGRIRLPIRLAGMPWHGHEMIFGFTVAVIAGFLLTAVRNWTNKPTATGGWLIALAALWVSGRLALLFGSVLPPLLTAAIDLAFLPALALAVALPLWRARNWRNVGFVPLLLGLFGVNVAFHFGGPGMASRALQLGVDVILLIVVVVGGRVIPMFTRNAVPAAQVRKSALLDWLAFGWTALVLVSDLLSWSWAVGAWVAFGAAGLNALRMSGWASMRTALRPILWVLHLGYVWLPIGFLMRGLVLYLPSIPATAPLHAHTVGAIGVLTLGMMSRVALGHTGRMLEVRPAVTMAYGLIGLAAIVRAVFPLFAPAWYLAILVVAGLLWAAGFLLFTIVYGPILTQPRVDGRPG